MDFWAQHKDFVLRVLAGLAVFLVALIARGITYGDELEQAQKDNRRLKSRIAGMRIAGNRDIGLLLKDKQTLQDNARTIADQIAFVGSPEQLQPLLIRRTLSYLREFREDPEGGAARLDRAVRMMQEALRIDLNGGFSQLRLRVAESLREEAQELDIGVPEKGGFGFELATRIAEKDLERYLLQLELGTRIVRYCIDARIDSIEDVRAPKASGGGIRGANPEFMREFELHVRFRAGQQAAVEVLERLGRELPAAPDRSLDIGRLDRPRNHVEVALTSLAIAIDLDEKLPFGAPKKEERR